MQEKSFDSQFTPTEIMKFYLLTYTNTVGRCEQLDALVNLNLTNKNNLQIILDILKQELLGLQTLDASLASDIAKCFRHQKLSSVTPPLDAEASRQAAESFHQALIDSPGIENKLTCKKPASLNETEKKIIEDYLVQCKYPYANKAVNVKMIQLLKKVQQLIETLTSIEQNQSQNLQTPSNIPWAFDTFKTSKQPTTVPIQVVAVPKQVNPPTKRTG